MVPAVASAMVLPRSILLAVCCLGCHVSRSGVCAAAASDPSLAVGVAGDNETATCARRPASRGASASVLLQKTTHQRRHEHRPEEYEAFAAHGILVKRNATTTGLSMDAVPENLTCSFSYSAREVHPRSACPENCPFTAMDLAVEGGCHFQCVVARACGELDPMASVADHKRLECRECHVPGCQRCGAKHVDYCLECGAGFILLDGYCFGSYRHAWIAVVVVTAVVGLIVGAWYLELRTRAITNQSGLAHGLRYRLRTCLHRENEFSDGPRSEARLWPLGTNLLHEEVAGPGLILFFRFQLGVVIWALVLLSVWIAAACWVSSDLFVLGLKTVRSTRDLCWITSWGYNTQHKTLAGKVVFLFIAYVLSTVGACLLSAWQYWRHSKSDDATTMADFAAFVTGLPQEEDCDGEQECTGQAEEKLRTKLQAATGQPIVGVSICWDFADVQDLVNEMIGHDTDYRHKRHSRALQIQLVQQEEEDVASRRVRSLFRRVDSLFGIEDQSGIAGMASSPPATGRSTLSTGRESEELEVDKMSSTGSKETIADVDPAAVDDSAEERACKVLKSIKSTGCAYVVFETEDARDAAVANFSPRGALAGASIEKVDLEPESVHWEHIGTSTAKLVRNVCYGVGIILGAVLAWTAAFYLPYAYYVTSFSYASGEEPGILWQCLFSMTVVVGNQIMYFVCSAVALGVGFISKDSSEVAYIIMYTLATTINSVMDLFVTYYTTYLMLTGMGAHTHDGKDLGELSTVELLSSYPMQKNLGFSLLLYAVPCCFPLPFFIEPIATISLPCHIAELVVRSNTKARGLVAEKIMGFFNPMDRGRYADILLNVNLVVCMLFFPGGFVVPILGALIVSHIYIYFYDHYRVLRKVPGFYFSSSAPDQCASAMMALPCALLLVVLFVKLDKLIGTQDASIASEFDFAPDQTGVWFNAKFLLCIFFAHLAVHLVFVFCVVPLVAQHRHVKSNENYVEVAQKTPCTWFSANPIHCLRSKHIYRHCPPCGYFIRGKEQLLLPNPDIGAYYDGQRTVSKE